MFKRVLNMFKRNKTIVLNNFERVNDARARVESALSTFKQIHQEIEETNVLLDRVIEEETQKVTEIERNRDRAVEERNMNLSLQGKIAEFLK